MLKFNPMQAWASDQTGEAMHYGNANVNVGKLSYSTLNTCAEKTVFNRADA